MNREEMNAVELVTQALRMSGMTALVTGAGSGIGKATAVLLAAAGAAVVAGDIDREGLERTGEEVRLSGGTCYTYRVDVSLQEERERFVEEAVRVGGRVDVLANVAGINRREPSLEMTLESWRQVIGVNLEGTVFLSQLAARQMVAAGKGGSIVNVSSTYGFRGAPDRVAYGASKAAVAQITRNLALDWGRYGIRVNAVAPGPIHTALTAPQFSDPDYVKQMLTRVPLGRIGRPMEVAAAILFLCSPIASFITGHTLGVDGGYLAS